VEQADPMSQSGAAEPWTLVIVICVDGTTDKGVSDCDQVMQCQQRRELTEHGRRVDDGQTAAVDHGCSWIQNLMPGNTWAAWCAGGDGDADVDRFVRPTGRQR
jgi:hypothetical protein